MVFRLDGATAIVVIVPYTTPLTPWSPLVRSPLIAAHDAAELVDRNSRFDPRYIVVVSPLPVLVGSNAGGVFQPRRPVSPVAPLPNVAPPLIERRSAPNCDSA